MVAVQFRQSPIKYHVDMKGEKTMSKEICNDCGCVINTESDAFIVDAYGNYVCADCATDYRECDDCGKYYPRDDMQYTYDGRWVCDDCAYYYTECACCGYLVPNNKTENTRDGDVCPDCLYDEYAYCYNCNEYVHRDDFDWDRDMCDRCASACIVKPYHYHKGQMLKFFKSAMEKAGIKPSPTWYMGVEWELCGHDAEYHAEKLYNILGDRAVYEDDCTVDVECIFMPHSYEAIIESGEIKRAFDYAADNFRDEDEDAGLHIHVSRTAFGETEEEQNENIAKIVMLHTEGYSYDMLKKLSRRTDYATRWARPIRKGNTKTDTIDHAKRYVEYYDNDHGVAINCGNSATVEFRLGAGTVNYDNFIAWVKIIKMLVDKCKTIDMEDANNFYVWFADADDSLKQYMESRGVIWEEPKVVTTEDYRDMMMSLMDKMNEQLTARGCSRMDYNTMLTVLCNADVQTRVALGYM